VLASSPEATSWGRIHWISHEELQSNQIFATRAFQLSALCLESNSLIEECKWQSQNNVFTKSSILKVHQCYFVWTHFRISNRAWRRSLFAAKELDVHVQFICELVCFNGEENNPNSEELEQTRQWYRSSPFQEARWNQVEIEYQQKITKFWKG